MASPSLSIAAPIAVASPPRVRALARRVAWRIGVIVLASAGVAIVASYGYAAYRHRTHDRTWKWSGTVEVRTIEVGSRVGGRVEAVLAREGDDVVAGQPIARLEPGDLDAQRLQATGQLEQAEANLSRVTNRGDGARVHEVAAARARVRTAEVAVDKAALGRSRSERLLRAGAVPAQELDDARFAERDASARRDAERAQLDQLLRGTTDDVKSFEGQVDAAKGRLAQLQTMRDELVIRAPRAARIEALRLRPGDIIAPDAIAARLLESDELYIRIYIPETQLGAIRPGQEVALTVDSFPDRTFHAVVESIGAEGEFTPRNLQTVDERADQVFAARLHPIDGDGVVRAGMAAVARVPR